MKRATVFMSAALLIAPGFMGLGMATPQGAGGGMQGMPGQMWRQHGRDRAGRHNFLRFMARRLNLTDQQKTEIRGIIKNEMAATKDLRAKLRENRQALMQFNLPKEQVQTLAQEQGNLIAQMIESAEATKAQIYNVLTPEQQQQLQQMRNAWQQRHQERMQQNQNKPAPNGGR